MTSKNKPLITIIVPIYNDELFLEKCLVSIQKQTYKNIEILLIDDGSTDSSPSIIEKFKQRDRRVKLIHKQNSGVSNSRNLGIKKASGKYICFSDADDILSSNYIEYLFTLAHKFDADISLTTQMFNNFDKRQIVDENIQKMNSEEAAINILSYNIPIGVYCKLFKTSFLRDNNINFNEELYMGEGFNFNIDAFQRTDKIVSSNKKIYFYRRNNSTSATTRFSIGKCRNEIKAINLIKKNLILHSNRVINAWNFAYWRTNSDVFDIIVLAKKEAKYPQLYKKCKKVVRYKAYYAWKAPVSQSNRLRALVMMTFPKIIPWAMIQRNRKYNVKVKH